MGQLELRHLADSGMTCWRERRKHLYFAMAAMRLLLILEIYKGDLQRTVSAALSNMLPSLSRGQAFHIISNNKIQGVIQVIYHDMFMLT